MSDIITIVMDIIFTGGFLLLALIMLIDWWENR